MDEQHRTQSPTLTRRETLAAGIAALATTMLPGTARAAHSFDDLRQWAADGVAAAVRAQSIGAVEKRRGWEEAARRFSIANQHGRLSEPEMRVWSAGLRLLGRGWEALDVARENNRRHPGPASAQELCMALAAAGNYVAARKLLRELVQIRRLGDVGPRVEDGKWELGIKQWEFTIRFHHEGYVAYALQRFQRNGYYECYVPPDLPEQRSAFAVSGDAKHEKVHDPAGNRIVRLWPVGDAPVAISIILTQIPSGYDLAHHDWSTYELPEGVRGYLGTTVRCDPTTEAVQRVAAEVKQPSRWSTILAAKDYLETQLRYPRPEEADGLRAYFDQHGNTADSVLKCGMGWCWGQSHAICAILRACGIAARQRCAFIGVDGPNPVPGMHQYLEWYEPGLGWIPFEGFKQLGSSIRGYIPVIAETTDASGPVSSVEGAFYGMYWGGSGEEEPLKNYAVRFLGLSLEEPGTP